MFALDLSSHGLLGCRQAEPVFSQIMIITFSSHTCPRQEGNTHITHSDLADEVAGHCPADQLPIEKHARHQFDVWPPSSDFLVVYTQSVTPKKYLLF